MTFKSKEITTGLNFIHGKLIGSLKAERFEWEIAICQSLELLTGSEERSFPVYVFD